MTKSTKHKVTKAQIDRLEAQASDVLNKPINDLIDTKRLQSKLATHLLDLTSDVDEARKFLNEEVKKETILIFVSDDQILKQAGAFVKSALYFVKRISTFYRGEIVVICHSDTYPGPRQDPNKYRNYSKAKAELTKRYIADLSKLLNSLFGNRGTLVFFDPVKINKEERHLKRTRGRRQRAGFHKIIKSNIMYAVRAFIAFGHGEDGHLLLNSNGRRVEHSFLADINQDKKTKVSTEHDDIANFLNSFPRTDDFFAIFGSCNSIKSAELVSKQAEAPALALDGNWYYGVNGNGGDIISARSNPYTKIKKSGKVTYSYKALVYSNGKKYDVKKYIKAYSGAGTKNPYGVIGLTARFLRQGVTPDKWIEH